MEETWWIVGFWWQHVGAVSSAVDQDGLEGGRDVGCDAQYVPGVDVTVDEEDVGGSVLNVLATIVDVGLGDSLRWVEVLSEDVDAHLKAGVERNEVSKRLVGRVGGLEVSELGTGLIDPRSAGGGIG